MASITGGSSVITPDVVLGFSSSREGRTNVHDIIAAAFPDATLRPAGSRAGRIKLGFIGASAETDSATAETVLAEGKKYAYLTDPARPSLALAFVVPAGGRIERVLSDVTRASWTVEVDYREVSA